MADEVKSLAHLKQLGVREQGILLLQRLAKGFPRGQSFAKQNFFLEPYGEPDPYGLANGYAREQVRAVLAQLLGEPWHYLEQNFYIASVQSPGFFEITEKGWSVEKDGDTYVANDAAIAALAFMHRDLQSYGHYFRERKQKEAVAAAFRRVENRLNEVRDASKVPSNSGASGTALPHKLFDSRDLNFPFPDLAASSPTARNAYLQSLKNLLASGIGWFRNSFDHEPHNLPDFDDAETIELLFVASYMLRIIDKSISAPAASIEEQPKSLTKDPAPAKGSTDPKLARNPNIKSPLSLRAVVKYQRLSVPGGGDDELYMLLVSVENDGELDATDFQLDVEIPAHFLDGGGHRLQVASERDGFALFRITNRDVACQMEHFYPGKKTKELICFNYAIRGVVKFQQPKLLQEKVRATVFSGSMKSKVTELSIADLMD